MTFDKEFMFLVSNNYGVIHKVINEYIPLQWQEDVQQDIIIEAYRSYPSFKQESKFSTWLYKVALFQCIAWLRKERIRERGLKNYHAEDSNFNYEIEELFIRGFEKLSLLRQELLVMKYLLQLRVNKISQLTLIKPDHIRTELFRARKDIRKTYFKK